MVTLTKKELQRDIWSYAEVDGNIYAINPVYVDEDRRLCLAFYSDINDCYEYAFPWDDDFSIQYDNETRKYTLTYPGIRSGDKFNFRLLRISRNHI